MSRHDTSRRTFLKVATAGLAGAAIGPAAMLPREAGAGEALLYPSMDLSCFDVPISPAPADIRFGYAAITWGGDDRQAIADIAEVGFAGIQLRSNILPEFGDRPGALRDLLARHGLTMVALSSGNVRIDPAVEHDELARHVRHAAFVRDVGGLYLQVTDERPKGRQVRPEDYRRLGRLITEIGKRTADLGVPLGYHNHMHNLGERPDEVDRILDAADPRYAKLLLDTAHYHQGGGDPAAAIERYRDRLLFLHIKDVESPTPGPEDAPGRTYRFVELGRGQVDLPGVFSALTRVRFRGWAVVELDSVPDGARTPKESAVLNRRYLEERIGVAMES